VLQVFVCNAGLSVGALPACVLALLPRLNTLDLLGCFSTMELGHGSVVMGICTMVSGARSGVAAAAVHWVADVMLIP
jgi:hypothetical protein